MFQFLFIFFLLVFCLGMNNHWHFSLSGRKGKTVFIICIFVLGCLAAFRTSVVGNDTKEYIRIFQECEELIRNGTRFEIGYLYYNLFISLFSHQPRLLFVVTSSFIFTSYGIFIWKYSQRPKVALIFFFLITFGLIVNTMRQCMAICILLFGIDSLLWTRYFRFMVIVFLATLFHITSIIFLLVLPLSFIKLNGKTLLIFVIGAVLAYIMFSEILNIGFSYFSMYEYYSNGKYFEGETRLASMVKLFFSLLLFGIGYFTYVKYTSQNWRKSHEGRIYHLLLLLQLIAVLIDFLSLKVNLLDRLDMYFTALSFVLISDAIYLIPSGNRRIITIILLVLYVSYNCVAMAYRPEWNRVYPIELSWTLL